MICDFFFFFRWNLTIACVQTTLEKHFQQTRVCEEKKFFIMKVIKLFCLLFFFRSPSLSVFASTAIAVIKQMRIFYANSSSSHPIRQWTTSTTKSQSFLIEFFFLLSLHSLNTALGLAYSSASLPSISALLSLFLSYAFATASADTFQNFSS